MSDPRVAFAEEWWGELAGPALMARANAAPREHLREYYLECIGRQVPFLSGDQPVTAPYVDTFNHCLGDDYHSDRFGLELKEVFPKIAALLLTFETVYVQDPIGVGDPERLWRWERTLAQLHTISHGAGLWGNGLRLVDGGGRGGIDLQHPGFVKLGELLIESPSEALEEWGVPVSGGHPDDPREWLIEPFLLRGLRAAHAFNYSPIPTIVGSGQDARTIAEICRRVSRLRVSHDAELIARGVQIQIGGHSDVADMVRVLKNEPDLLDVRTAMRSALARVADLDPASRASVRECMDVVEGELMTVARGLRSASRSKAVADAIGHESRSLMFRVPVAAGLGLVTGSPWIAGAAIVVDSLATSIPNAIRAGADEHLDASAWARLLTIAK